MLFAGWEVRIVKTCDRELENAAQGRRPKATFSSFSLYGPTLGRQMTCWFFFCSKLVLQITNGFASVCLSLVHPLCDKHNTSQISISISTGKKEHVLFSCAYAYFTCVMLIAQAWTRLYATLSLNRLAPRLLKICKKSLQRSSNSDTRQRCIKEEILVFFDLLFDSIVAFISPFISLNLTMPVFCIGNLHNSRQQKSFFDVVKEERSLMIKV